MEDWKVPISPHEVVLDAWRLSMVKYFDNLFEI